MVFNRAKNVVVNATLSDPDLSARSEASVLRCLIYLPTHSEKFVRMSDRIRDVIETIQRYAEPQSVNHSTCARTSEREQHTCSSGYLTDR